MCFQRGVQAGEEIVRLNALKEAPVFVKENEIAPDELREILLRGWVLRKVELLHLEVVKQNIDQLGIVAVKSDTGYAGELCNLRDGDVRKTFRLDQAQKRLLHPGAYEQILVADMGFHDTISRLL